MGLFNDRQLSLDPSFTLLWLNTTLERLFNQFINRQDHYGIQIKQYMKLRNAIPASLTTVSLA
jgi:hypothetical protein